MIICPCRIIFSHFLYHTFVKEILPLQPNVQTFIILAQGNKRTHHLKRITVKQAFPLVLLGFFHNFRQKGVLFISLYGVVPGGTLFGPGLFTLLCQKQKRRYFRIFFPNQPVGKSIVIFLFTSHRIGM